MSNSYSFVNNPLNFFTSVIPYGDEYEHTEYITIKELKGNESIINTLNSNRNDIDVLVGAFIWMTGLRPSNIDRLHFNNKLYPVVMNQFYNVVKIRGIDTVKSFEHFLDSIDFSEIDKKYYKYPFDKKIMALFKANSEGTNSDFRMLNIINALNTKMGTVFMEDYIHASIKQGQESATIHFNHVYPYLKGDSLQFVKLKDVMLLVGACEQLEIDIETFESDFYNSEISMNPSKWNKFKLYLAYKKKLAKFKLFHPSYYKMYKAWKKKSYRIKYELKLVK